MTEDKFFERISRDAQQLRYAPSDDRVWTRLAARIEEQIHAQPTVAQLLEQWFRPVIVSFAALSLVAALSLQWVENTREPVTVDTMAAAPATDIGDIYVVE